MTWNPGIPSVAGPCLVRPTRNIYLSFRDGQSACWYAGEERIVRFLPVMYGGEPSTEIAGTLGWPDCGGTVLLTEESPVEWRPIDPLPDAW